MKVALAVLVGCMLSIGFATPSVAQEVRGDDGWRGNDASYAQHDRDDRRGRRDRRIDWREAERIVRRAYRDILRREADASGLRSYTRSMVHDGWSEEDVRRSLRNSDEYRRQRGRRY